MRVFFNAKWLAWRRLLRLRAPLALLHNFLSVLLRNPRPLKTLLTKYPFCGNIELYYIIKGSYR